MTDFDGTPSKPRMFSAADLAESIQMVHRICFCAPDTQARLSEITSSLKKLLRAESASVFESRKSHPFAMTELFRESWRDWHTDRIVGSLRGMTIQNQTHSHRNMIWNPPDRSSRYNWHCIASCLAAGADHYFTLAFARRAQAFSDREAGLLRTIHASPVFELVSQRRPSTPTRDMSPRQREVLASLLRGQSEKQIAHQLKVSRHTVHVYVKALYRRHSVNSRGELLSLSIDPATKQILANRIRKSCA